MLNQELSHIAAQLVVDVLFVGSTSSKEPEVQIKKLDWMKFGTNFFN